MQAVNHDPKLLLPTQDLPPLYLENSNCYLFSRESFAVEARRIGASPAFFEMDPIEATDIDEETDFALATSLALLSA